MDKHFKKTFFLICLGGGVLFGALLFLTFGADGGFTWWLALLCFGMGLVWAVAFYFIWMLVQKKSKPFSFENPKAQAKLAEYEAARGVPYEQLFYAFMPYGEGFKQAVCETRLYFESEGLHTAFYYFGKLYHFDIPYSAMMEMTLEDQRILVIRAKDVGPLCVSIKDMTPEQLTWLTVKANSIP